MAAFDRLVRSLSDEDAAVGEAAAVGLVIGGGAAGLQAVLTAIYDLDEQVSSWIVEALGRFWRQDSAVPAETHRLVNEGATASIRGGAAQAIDYLRSPHPVEVAREPWEDTY